MTTLETTEQGEVGEAIVRYLASLKKGRTDHLAIANAERNAELLKDGKGRSIAMLRKKPIGEGDSAIVMGAGPSLWKQDPIKRIKETGYKGALIVTESAIAYCLRNGVIPDIAVTVDPDDKRMVRFFGDPTLSQRDLDHDDYFRRLKRDFRFDNEFKANAEVMDLLDSYGSKMTMALATSASEPVVNRVFDVGMDVYWWNPMLDDPDEADSITNRLAHLNRLPCINAGGNVGTAAWMMAHLVLGKRNVAVLGLDFSYLPDQSYERTHYFKEIRDLVGEENMDSVFMRVENPFNGKHYFTDPAFMLYRNVFLELAAEADCTTYNCTEGGILFGDHVTLMAFDRFLERFA